MYDFDAELKDNALRIEAELEQRLTAQRLSGPGLPPEELARAGERFFRGRQGPLPGSGLGLAIARTVAQRHGGEMRVSVGPEGRGLAVTMELAGTGAPSFHAGKP